MPLKKNEEFLKERSNIYDHQCKTNDKICNIFENFRLIAENFLNLLGSVLIVLYLITFSCCMLKEEIGRSHLTSALLAGAGVSCIILGIFSSELTINGANRLGYLVCALFLNQKTQKCLGDGDIYAMGQKKRTEMWQNKLQIIQGAVIVTCIVQIFIASAGLKFLLKYIRPLSIAPTMILLGVFVTKTSVVLMAKTCWSLFISGSFLLLVLYLIHYHYAQNNYEAANNNGTDSLRNRLYVGLLCVLTMWITCAILSYFDFISIRSGARTDAYTGALNDVSAVSFPSFFQWGIPQWKPNAIVIMLPAAFISIFEILANYHIASKRESSEKLPTNKKNSYNKSSSKDIWTLIILEATFCLFVSAIGTALGINVAYKNKNQKFHEIYVGIALILIGLSGTLCTLLMTIPEPIMAIFILSLFLSVFFEGLYLMRCIDMKSSRNLNVLGISLFLGVVVPIFAENAALQELTGFSTMDNILFCILSSEFLVGGLTALILDNLIQVANKNEYVQHENEKLALSEEQDNENSVGFCDCLSPFCM